jgi:hypothetical protein
MGLTTGVGFQVPIGSRIFSSPCCPVSQDSIASIVTGYVLDNREVGVPSLIVVKNFHFFMSSRLALGSTQPLIQWIMGVLSPGIKRPRREADHSPPTSAEVKKTWVYTSTPPYAFMV